MKALRTADLATAVMVSCAVIITALLLQREIHARKDGLTPQGQNISLTGGRQGSVDDRDPLPSAHGHRVGPETAGLTITVFSDFQCPACRATASQLRILQAEAPAEVAVVFRHFPQEEHPYAWAAALAAECGAEQGRFETVHDVIFGNPATLGETDWSTLGRMSGIDDIPRFEDCIRSRRGQETITRDLQEGEALGVEGTPTLFINEVVWLGVPGLDTLRTFLDQSRPPSMDQKP